MKNKNYLIIFLSFVFVFLAFFSFNKKIDAGMACTSQDQCNSSYTCVATWAGGEYSCVDTWFNSCSTQDPGSTIVGNKICSGNIHPQGTLYGYTCDDGQCSDGLRNTGTWCDNCTGQSADCNPWQSTWLITLTDTCPVPHCGDGICSKGETPDTCLADCPSGGGGGGGSVCGAYGCEVAKGETCASCPGDCGFCPLSAPTITGPTEGFVDILQNFEATLGLPGISVGYELDWNLDGVRDAVNGWIPLALPDCSPPSVEGDPYECPHFGGYISCDWNNSSGSWVCPQMDLSYTPSEILVGFSNTWASLGSKTFKVRAVPFPGITATPSPWTSYNINIISGPTSPTVTGPTTGYQNVDYAYTIVSTDSGSLQLKYEIDWNNDGVVDQVIPLSGYAPSGSIQSVTHHWPIIGNNQIWKVRAVNSGGVYSNWNYLTMTINALPVSDPNCGPAAKTYQASDSAFSLNQYGQPGFCRYGWVLNSSQPPSFPGQGYSVVWVCKDLIWGSGQLNNCVASRLAPVQINGACGTSAKQYTVGEAFPSGTYCSSGTLNGSPSLGPNNGDSASWGCSGSGGGISIPIGSCTATRVSQYGLSVFKTYGGYVTSAPVGINTSSSANCALAGGTWVGSTCSKQYSNGTSVTLTPINNPNWKFAGWQGGCPGTSSGNSCIVTITGNVTLTPNFVLRPFNYIEF